VRISKPTILDRLKDKNLNLKKDINNKSNPNPSKQSNTLPKPLKIPKKQTKQRINIVQFLKLPTNYSLASSFITKSQINN
jgi:hypothetical protein